MTKTEQLAREVCIALNKGVDPFVVGSGVEPGSVLSSIGVPIDVLLPLILEFIGGLFALWKENCDGEGPFARLVQRAGPFQEMRAVRQWRLIERRERVETGVSPRELVRTARKVALSKEEQWLNDAAAEITKPDWMF